MLPVLMAMCAAATIAVMQTTVMLKAEVIRHCPVLVFGRRRNDRLTNGAHMS
jgi:hypothetical protein